MKNWRNQIDIFRFLPRHLKITFVTEFEAPYDTLTLSISSLLIPVKDEQTKKFNDQHAKIVQKLCNFDFLRYIDLFNDTPIQIAFLKYLFESQK